MAQLMGDKVVAGKVEMGTFVVQRSLCQRRRGDIFHTSEDEIGHYYLSIFRVWILDAEIFAEELDHLRRLFKTALGIFLTPFGNIVLQLDVFGLVFDD